MRIQFLMATVAGVPIEPYLTDQWYVDAETLAQASDQQLKMGAPSLCRKVGQDLLRMDAQYPALVYLPPALVGPSDPGMVWARWRDFSSSK